MELQVTSHQAYASVTTPRSCLPLTRERTYEEIRRTGSRGLTCEDCERILEIKHQISELVNQGRICDSHRTRMTCSLRKAIVWVEKGLEP